MKTDELISLLATGTVAVDPLIAVRRYAVAVATGLVGAALLMVSLLKVRADLAEAALLPLFWLKIGFVASLMVASLFATLRLSRPGARTDCIPLAMATPIIAMWVVVAAVVYVAEPAARSALFLGQTWQSCPLLIALLSAPALVALIWAMKGLAPTRPRLAGFAAGLLSGAMAALVYCLHCPELEAPFIGLWYLLGMLIPAGAGVWLGETLLRW